jgi:hypothetical protein
MVQEIKAHASNRREKEQLNAERRECPRLRRFALCQLGLSSTIIDFRDFSVVRVGHEFAKLEDTFKRRFRITLRHL